MLNDRVAKCAKVRRWLSFLRKNMKLAKRHTLQLHIQRLFFFFFFFFNGSTQQQGWIFVERCFRRSFLTPNHYVVCRFLVGKKGSEETFMCEIITVHEDWNLKFFPSKKIPTQKISETFESFKKPFSVHLFEKMDAEAIDGQIHAGHNVQLRIGHRCAAHGCGGERHGNQNDRQARLGEGNSQPTTREHHEENQENLFQTCAWDLPPFFQKTRLASIFFLSVIPTGFWLVFGVIWKKRTKKESDESLTFFSHLPLVGLVCHTLLYELANGDDKFYDILIYSLYTSYSTSCIVRIVNWLPMLLGVGPKAHDSGSNYAKWMVKMMENPIKSGWFGGSIPLFLETPQKKRIGVPRQQPLTNLSMASMSRFQTSILMSQQEVNLCPPHAPCSHSGTQHQT